MLSNNPLFHAFFPYAAHKELLYISSEQRNPLCQVHGMRLAYVQHKRAKIVSLDYQLNQLCGKCGRFVQRPLGVSLRTPAEKNSCAGRDLH